MSEQLFVQGALRGMDFSAQSSFWLNFWKFSSCVMTISRSLPCSVFFPTSMRLIHSLPFPAQLRGQPPQLLPGLTDPTHRWALITKQVLTSQIFNLVPRASLVAQAVNNLPAMWEAWVQSLGQEDPLEKGMAIHSSFLAWESHGSQENERNYFLS